MSPISPKYRLLEKFRVVFEGTQYKHRNSSIGDSVAIELYEDLSSARDSGIVRRMNWSRALFTFAVALGLQQYSFAQEESGIVGVTKEFVQVERGLWTSP